jgi:hypothetical protein
VSLFFGAERFACAVNVILGEQSTVTSQIKDGSSGIRWTVNDVLLTEITNVCIDQVVNSYSNAWVRVADLFVPKVKDFACPW